MIASTSLKANAIFGNAPEGDRRDCSRGDALIDRWGRPHTYLRISVTEKCNLGCVYCRPGLFEPKGTSKNFLTVEEWDRVVRVLARAGIEKVRITGGEPLVRRDLSNLVHRLKISPGIRTVGLTTNGTLLDRHLPSLKQAGLDCLNVSLDTLRSGRFESIARQRGFSQVIQGIRAALRAGYNPLKINVVVMGGVNDDEILDFVELTRFLPLHIRFIEYMPFTSNGWEDSTFVPYAAMKAVIEERYGLIPVPLHDRDGNVSKDFRVQGFEGRIGFITSISDHFCSTCSRLRILADGRIKNCLFQPPAGNIRDVIRAGGRDTDLLREVQEVLYQKPESHPPVRELVNLDSNEMVMIGG